VDPAIEGRIVELAIEQPAYGQVRVCVKHTSFQLNLSDER
jgi:hypothetical protein